MSDDYSRYDYRRKAPLHFYAKADNARYSAYVLSNVSNTEAERLGRAASYGGGCGVALHESFVREAAISLELIVKAVIAQKLEIGLNRPDVKSIGQHHKVDQLWLDADLPVLDETDQYVLVYASTILNWAGRYAATKKDSQMEADFNRLDRYAEKVKLGDLELTKIRVFDFQSFDRVYNIAAKVLWSIRNSETLA